MKTILIATDFSDTANNATLYGAAFAENVGVKKIILYNAYAIAISTEIAWTMLEQDGLAAASKEGLEHASMLLKPFCGKGIEIETMSDVGFFGQRLQEAAVEAQADMIIIGTTGGSGFEKSIFGSNALTAVHSTTVPILIVPPKSVWKPLQKIAWASDYQHVEETAPMQKIETFLELTKARLFIVHNAERDEENFDPEVVKSSKFIHDFFKDRPFEIQLLGGKSLSDAINKYIFSNSIDWLIVAPHKHTWLANLFTKDHTKELVFHTHIPILCLHTS